MEADISKLRKTGHFYFALTRISHPSRLVARSTGSRRFVCEASILFGSTRRRQQVAQVDLG